MQKGRLQPGRMFLVDTEEGRIVADEEIKAADRRGASPTGSGSTSNLVRTRTSCPSRRRVHEPDHETVCQRQQAFGYTFEDLKMLILAPMASDGVGADRLDGQRHAAGRALRAAAAALQLLQAALRPGDQSAAGLHPRGVHHRRGDHRRPRGQPARAEAGVLPPARAADADPAQRGTGQAPAARRRAAAAFKSITLPMLFRVGRRRRRACARRSRSSALAGLASASPRGTTSSSSPTAGIDPDHAPIPALLAVGGVHHHLIREGTRTRVGLVLESGEPREVHHFALLDRLRRRRDQSVPGLRDARRHDPRGLAPGHRPRRPPARTSSRRRVKGVVKVMSKMGISTIQSYRGAQIFEAIGLQPGL